MIAINDPCFPQTSKIIDMGLMTRIFQENLFANSPFESIVVESCKIKNQRHKAGKSFVIAYDLMLLNTQTGNRQQQIIGGRLCKWGQELLGLEQESDSHQNKSGTNSAFVYLTELEMLVWVFPLDRKMTHLAKIMDLNFLKSYLAGKLPLLDCDRHCRIEEVETEVMQYLPERSCMIRYRLTIIDTNNTKKISRTIYGKTYRDNKSTGIDIIMNQLARQLPKAAISLGYDEGYRTLWQSHLSGTPLEWSDFETQEASELLTKMALCVADFQKCEITASNRHGFKEIDSQLFETIKAAELQGVLIAEQISTLVSQQIAKREKLAKSEIQVRPLHQDLHLGNFILDDNQLCLIDFDTICVGDPLIDIGSLVANIYRRGINSGRDVVYLENIVNQLLYYYQISVTWKIDQSRLNWFISAALVHEVIRRILRQRHEIGLSHIQTYIDLSKRYVDLIAEELESA
jgi:hypothetical protein